MMGIIKGSNYDNPYARPVSLEPFAGNSFSAFDDARPDSPKRLTREATDAFSGFKQQKQEEYTQDWVAEIQSEFQEAQRRNTAARPRGKSQDAMMSETLKDATNLATGGKS
jgi:hypothetical protein